MDDQSFETQKKELKDFIFKQHRAELKRCLWHGNNCKKKIIHAHSIQNNAILDRLSKDNHVIVLDYELDLDKGPKPGFKFLSKNKATTFTGFCYYHDELIFKPIEKSKIDCENKEHLFLLAYRAVCREFHYKLRATNNFQAFIEKNDILWENDNNYGWKKECLQAMLVIYLSESYSMYRYKFFMDKAYANNNFDIFLDNIIITLPLDRLTLAVNSSFWPINNMIKYEDRKFPKTIMLNIFPQEDEYRIVFSFNKNHSEIVKEYLGPILTSDGNYQKYLISKLILQNCENFVLSPDYFSTFSESKKKDIIEYFTKNIFANKTDYENDNLFLF